MSATAKRATNISSPISPGVRTGEGLRDVLFDEIDLLRSGSGDRRRAMAVAGLAQQIINTIKVELDFQRHLSLMGSTADKAGTSEPMIKTLRLGK